MRLAKPLASLLIAVLSAVLLPGCAGTGQTFGASPVISGVPPGPVDVRKEEARGR